MELTAEMIRVLGSLVEKERTTPDQYPLSTNALQAACNQKTSRDPVVDYDARTVDDTVLALRHTGLARTAHSSGGRTWKHRHVLDEAWGLAPDELAVVAVLALRGPQTPGELRARTERYAAFGEEDDVETTLARLAAREEPLAANLGRAPGQSQDRWTHLLSGEPEMGAAPTGPVVAAAPRPAPPPPADPALVERVERLERTVARLLAELGLEAE